jgi:Tol biopolymer transport system component
VNVRKVLFLFFFLGVLAIVPLIVQVLWPAQATFRGHTCRVVAVVTSPDGKTLASMSEDETIKLWDVATRTERATLRGSNATFSFDGKTVAFTKGRTIGLYDVATGEVRATLRGHTDSVCSVDFSRDGKSLASGGCDKTVKLWDLATGKERATFRAHTSLVKPVSFSPDGKTLAWAELGPDAMIELWDLPTGKRRATLRVLDWSVDSLVFSPDGKVLATGGDYLTLWNASTGTKTATIDTPSEGVQGLTFSPDGKTLAAVAAGSPEIHVWDVVSGKKTATYEKSYRRPRPRLCRYACDMCPGDFEEHWHVPKSVWFTRDGELMALGFDNRDNTTVLMWKAAGVPGATQ